MLIRQTLITISTQPTLSMRMAVPTIWILVNNWIKKAWMFIQGIKFSLINKKNIEIQILIL